MATASLPTGLDAHQFMDWCCRGEHEDRAFELDRGTVVERCYPGTQRHGAVCAVVTYRVGEPLFRRRDGYVLANNAGLLMERSPDTVFCPDLVVYNHTSEDPLSHWFATRTPDLVVEILDDRDDTDAMVGRAARFHEAGVPLVWLVCSERRRVAPLRPGQPYVELSEADELTGNGVLPEFRCRVADLFALPGRPPAAPNP